MRFHQRRGIAGPPVLPGRRGRAAQTCGQRLKAHGGRKTHKNEAGACWAVVTTHFPKLFSLARRQPRVAHINILQSICSFVSGWLCAAAAPGWATINLTMTPPHTHTHFQTNTNPIWIFILGHESHLTWRRAHLNCFIQRKTWPATASYK